jgi:predicted lipoprotein with Yx(FWY)xxD motif
MTLIKPLSLLTVTAVVALAAGCGSSGSSGSASASGGGAYGGDASYGSATKPVSAPPASVAGAATIRLAHGHLVDAKGRTLYLWEADKTAKSTCGGACAKAWPPVTTTGAPKAGYGVKASLLKTSKRAGGTQVTYRGHPLYRFAGDGKAGQANGQGSDAFGAEWYMVDAAGKAVVDD